MPRTATVNALKYSILGKMAEKDFNQMVGIYSISK